MRMHYNLARYAILDRPNCSFISLPQVNTYWDWSDVHRADRYLEALEQLRDRNASSFE